MRPDFDALSLQAESAMNQNQIDFFLQKPDREGDVLQTSFMATTPNAKATWQTTGIAPVPEPSTLLIGIGGLVSLAWKRIRKNG